MGPVGIALGPNLVYFTIGGLAVGAGMPPLPEENTVNVLDLATGEVSVIAELGPYEEANNRDATDVNPNLYGMARTLDGTLLVNDAGGNTIYSVIPDTGEFSLVAVVPNLTELTGAEPETEAGPRQPVPTGITVSEDGSTYVGLLSEFWPEGAPSVLRLEEDGTFTPIGGPLSFVVGVRVGPDGMIYASELFTLVEGAEEPGPGRVVRMSTDGEIEVILESVFMPHGLAFDADGNLYVAINSLVSGPGMPAGQVIRIDGVAAS